MVLHCFKPNWGEGSRGVHCGIWIWSVLQTQKETSTHAPTLRVTHTRYGVYPSCTSSHALPWYSINVDAPCPTFIPNTRPAGTRGGYDYHLDIKSRVTTSVTSGRRCHTLCVKSTLQDPNHYRQTPCNIKLTITCPSSVLNSAPFCISSNLTRPYSSWKIPSEQSKYLNESGTITASHEFMNSYIKCDDFSC